MNEMIRSVELYQQRVATPKGYAATKAYDLYIFTSGDTAAEAYVDNLTLTDLRYLRDALAAAIREEEAAQKA